jgi:hypothetical protein
VATDSKLAAVAHPARKHKKKIEKKKLFEPFRTEVPRR